MLSTDVCRKQADKTPEKAVFVFCYTQFFNGSEFLAAFTVKQVECQAQCLHRVNITKKHSVACWLFFMSTRCLGDWQNLLTSVNIHVQLAH